MPLNLIPITPDAAADLERVQKLRAGAAMMRGTIIDAIPNSTARGVALALITAGLEMAIREVMPDEG